MKIVDTPLLRKFFRAASSAILPSISCRILNYKILRTCRDCSAGSIESHPPRLGYGFRLPDESRFYGHRTGSSGFVIDELCELCGSAVRMGWRGERERERGGNGVCNYGGEKFRREEDDAARPTFFFDSSTKLFRK